jgi:hypothetical protein
VYYQPPSSVQMKYPCIRYSSDGVDVDRANNHAYITHNRYEGVIIDYDPDSKYSDNLIKHFQMCSLAPGFTKDGLNHFPFTLYY